ncbi:probable ribosomal protein MRP17, mitochondrial [Cephalotrichum gorgonifer]|uniref:Probable ribosomal protein MRP17, mitochondrial n=1 Tax=Cephalotrichum gorgonifer TaxID=2041049 RepID=A0AAE8N0E5_9PEZI|nr:probable ribosomal protein MRP17, mitochondrial [Cephalotrichum gorgonifer]
MHRPTIRHGLGRLAKPALGGRLLATSAEAEIAQAKAYCVAQIAKTDRSAFLIRQFVPRPVQDVYDALRVLNLELVRLPETVSNPTIGAMRIQFWRDSIDKTFAGTPPREPVCLLLRQALDDLERRGGASSFKSLKFWISRVIKTRERHMTDRPFPSLAALEEHAENTYSTLMYATLAAIPMRSMEVDHLASHIGKAAGIVALLRGIPILAAPNAPTTSPSGLGSTRRDPAILLPLDVMGETGLTEESVFRQGPQAPGFQDAVFKVATRANDHLITAREMLKNLQAGQHAGHDFEHEGEMEHVYEEETDAARDVRRGFGVLLEAVPAQDYLIELEKRDFDPWAVRAGWKLPWRIWRAVRQQRI